MSREEFIRLFNTIKENKKLVVISSGLPSGEYIQYIEGYGFCYSDKVLIGYTPEQVYTLVMIHSLWSRGAKFWLKENKD